MSVVTVNRSPTVTLQLMLTILPHRGHVVRQPASQMEESISQGEAPRNQLKRLMFGGLALTCAPLASVHKAAVCSGYGRGGGG